jgi:potassium channel subfamily K
MHLHAPPIRPGETWSQGYWHAVIAAILYMIGSVILMINMLGYFLGHYPQHFDLDDSQRTLILQTMMFFFWLAGGAAVFEKVSHFTYSDALYFCDVTVLTIGFGDFTSPNDAGRGLVFPYSVIGIIFLGLMINSIRNFAISMSRDKVIKAHEQNERARTIGRTVTSEQELRDRLGLPPATDSRKQSTGRRTSRADSLNRYGKFEVQGRTVTFHVNKTPVGGGGRGGAGRAHVKPTKALSRDAKMRARKEGNTDQVRRQDKRQKLLLLREEKDRFEAMREIQQNTNKFKQYYALAMSVFAFGVLWCLGALFFMLAEKREQNLSYFQALYFCYVSLLTIGYGDFSPRSNAGKAFFVVWSLLAIPTMTILISDMGDTVVAAINRGTFTLADWTVMPREGAWKDFLQEHPKIHKWLEDYNNKREAKKRLDTGFALQNPDVDIEAQDGNNHEISQSLKPTLELLAEKADQTEHQLARKLALAIKRAAQDLHAEPPKKYSYEEWVEFTRLIRFSAKSKEEVLVDQDEEGLVEWDWIGEESPMLADVTEAEWVLDRLCESLNRYTRRQAHKVCNLFPYNHICTKFTDVDI